MSISIVVAQYYLNDSELSLKLDKLCELIINHSDIHGLQIINMRSDYANYPFLDMSAYSEGLKKSKPSDLIIFINDTLFIKYPWVELFSNLVKLLPLLASIEKPAAIGSIHPSTDILFLDSDNQSRRHLSTFFFALNKQSLSLFKSIIEPLDGIELSFGRDWLNSQCKKYKALDFILHAHLGGINNPWVWKSYFNHKNNDLIISKSVTVTIEYMLSVKILNSGGCIYPINYSLKYKIKALLYRAIRNYRSNFNIIK